MEFTKDTSKLLTAVYKTYLERINSGLSKSSATQFTKDFYKDISCLSQWHTDDISYALSELNKAGFIKLYLSGSFVIQPMLIIQMENRFKSGLTEVAKYLADLIAGIVTGL